EVCGDDRLQHEVHQKLAEARLIDTGELDGADRAAVLRQCLGGGAALRGDEGADRLPPEPWLAGRGREAGIEARPLSGASNGDHREELVARAGDEELELAVLIDRPEGR